MAQFDEIQFPGWEVTKKLGEGSFGGVYEICRTLPDGRVEKCALKKLTVPEQDSDIRELYAQSYSKESITAHYKNQMSELVSEYSLAQSLGDCPNVVACHDIRYIQHDDEIGWDIYIRMELLNPLSRVLDAEYREKLVICLARDMCSALTACRKRGILHRDIKPGNILISNEGVFKLTDFGVAKVSGAPSAGTLTGTYGYMAPEVANRKCYGAQADLYSLGMVLYWLMNRRTLPFLPLDSGIPTAAQRQEAQERRFSGEPLPPPVDGSPELKQIVLKACAFRPEDRYQSAQELRRAIADWCRGKKTRSGAERTGLRPLPELPADSAAPEDTTDGSSLRGSLTAAHWSIPASLREDSLVVPPMPPAPEPESREPLSVLPAFLP